jgi:hypothetical protein
MIAQLVVYSGLAIITGSVLTAMWRKAREERRARNASPLDGLSDDDIRWLLLTAWIKHGPEAVHPTEGRTR